MVSKHENLFLRENVNITGIQFVTDEKGRKTGVLIDLKKHGAIWEDFWDGLTAESRRKEKSAPYEEYRATSLGLTILLLQSPLGLILPLVFAARATPAALPALSFNATPVPVAVRDLKAVMDRDLRQHRSNPYADYEPQQLYAYVGSRGIARPADAPFLYSNLGVGLLGQALAVRAGRSYANQLRQEITDPLRMSNTVVKLSTEQQRRFMQGYNEKHRPVHA